MWQFYAIGALFGGALESVVDKYALTVDKKVAPLAATFWRMSVFSALTAGVGFMGWAGAFHLSFVPLIFFMAVVACANALAYTYLLRHIEVTEYGVIAYLAPLVFLGIDSGVLHHAFSPSEISGIVLLVLGGALFSLDFRTYHLRKELSWRVWLLFGVSICYTGALAYSFKYAAAAYHMNAVSFYVSYTILASALLFALLAWHGRVGHLFSRASVVYLPRILVSKSFDTVSSLLWAQAILLATVSQVSAVNALQPLVLFATTILMQNILFLPVGEKLGRKRIRWKAVAVCFLVFGGWLVH